MAKSQPKTVGKSGVVDKVKNKVKKQKRKQGNKLQHCDPSVINKAKKQKVKKLENSEDGKVPEKSEPSPAPSNALQNIKNSNDTISSNWRDLMKNLKNDEDKKSEKTKTPFLRRNKKGQIISNQKMNHPKAVLVGIKEKKTKKARKDESSTIWFDDVDPLLLDKEEAEAGSGLVKSESYRGVTRVVGMDCEMVGVGTTGQDSILARVSIVNHFGHVLYDKFVAPREKVTDYRTEVSGVRPEDLVGAPEFKQVQTEVAELIKDRLLVGHAIHHDLKVLFLDHPKKLIRDTSKYKPFRAAFGGRTPGLKALTERFLGVKVQTGEHSSVQDSQAALRLYTMFRKDWEADRMARRIRNKNSSIKSKAKTKQLDQSRLVLTKQAGKALGSRPMYNPSDSEDEI